MTPRARTTAVAAGRAVAIAAFAALFATAPASADQLIVSRDGAIVTMNRDGTQVQPLVSPGELPLVESLTRPHVLPGGGAVVFNGLTNDFRQSPPFGTSCCDHFGDNQLGVYKWEAGQTTRLSGPSGPCSGPAQPYCTTRDLDPELFGNGRYIAQLWVFSGTGSNYRGHGELFTEALDGSDHQGYPTICSGISEFPGDASPSPVDPGKVVYTGCRQDGTPLLVFDFPGSSDFAFGDDERFVDPSWRPDGQVVVGAERGTDPGLWLYEPHASPTTARWLLHTGSTEVASPRFMGSDEIVFSAGGDLYTIPASCGAGGTPCTFPADATQITSGPADDSEVAWTSVADIRPAAAAPNGGGAPIAPGGGTGTAPGGGTGTTTPVQLVTAVRSLGTVFTARAGFRFGVTLRAAADVEVTVETVGSSRSRASRRLGTVTFKGKPGQNTFTVKKVRGKRLRPGRYRARVVAVAGSARSPSRTLRFRIRR